MKRACKGASFLEVIFALFLSSMMVAALMNHYIFLKRHYDQLQKELKEANQRLFVVDVFRNSIRSNGFSPCGSVNQLRLFDHRTGRENMASMISEENALLLKRMSAQFNEVLSFLSAQQIQITLFYALHVNRPLIIADCFHAEIFRPKYISVHGDHQVIQLSEPLRFSYPEKAFIGEWIEERFFIRSDILFYHRYHTDALLQPVHAMSIRMAKSMVTVNLTLNHEQSIEFETKVRTP